MLKDKLRPLVFRGILLILVLFLLECIGYFGLWINSRSVDWLANKNYFNIRAMLAGDENSDLFPKFLTLPYLGYIPFPGYTKKGVIQHNEDGYRGKRVPLQRSKEFRILCIGGSTTYGFGVATPDQAFPAQLEYLLDSLVEAKPELKQRFGGVEVINAGLDAATSAEELQQYLFKYRYYKPDAIIVHSGINDAEIVASMVDSFQLDYTHYRRINFHLEPLSQPMRFLMKSNLISFFVIRLFYSNFSILQNEYKHQFKQKYCNWTTFKIDSIIDNNLVEFYPFYRNTNSLFNEIKADKATLLILPTVLNKNDKHVRESGRYRQLTEFNNQISVQLGKEIGGVVIPFSFDSIQQNDCWIDDCHLNLVGEKRKAQLIYPYVAKILENSFGNN